MRDIGQDGIRAAEGDHGGPREEEALVDENAVAGEHERRQSDGGEPQDESHYQDFHGAAGGGGVVAQGIIADQRFRARWCTGVCRAVREGRDAQAEQPAEQPGEEDDDRERHREHRQGRERGHGHGHQDGVVQGACADAVDGLNHDGDDRGR